MRRQSHSTAEAHSVPHFCFGGWLENRRSRPAIFSVSLTGHVCLIAFLVFVDLSALRPLPVTAEAEILRAESERKIVWYNLARDLPPVAPPEPIVGEPGARAEKRSANQTIIANDPGAASDKQKIWDPASDRILTEDVPAPNIVASSPAPERFELPRADIPTPAADTLPTGKAPVDPQAAAPELSLEQLAQMERLRFQQQRREQTAPADQAIVAPAAPKVEPTAMTASSLEQLGDLERLRFQTQQRLLTRPGDQAVDAEAAPEISPQIQEGLNLAQLSPFVRLRFRMTAPSASAPTQQALEGGAAPMAVPAGTPSANLSAVYRTEALRYGGGARTLTTPSAEPLARIANAPDPGAIGGAVNGAGSAHARGTAYATLIGDSTTIAKPASPAPSNRTAQGTGGPGTSDLAVVGLNPSPVSDLNVPRGRRPGRFSAAPDGGDGNGKIGTPGGESGARVPNLSVSPARRGTRLASVPTVVPGDGERSSRGSDLSDGVLMALNRLTGPGAVEKLSAADLERAAKAHSEPKERAPLEDRTVYTMAINMPNISSYQGSWIVRYAQLDEEKEEAPFSAPAPLRKVDPKYVAQAALEGIEGEVLLYAVIRPDGGIGDAKVMRGIDERLDQSALEAIEKWQFKPASRDGEPIAVEALFSIPFQLSGLKP